MEKNVLRSKELLRNEVYGHDSEAEHVSELLFANKPCETYHLKSAVLGKVKEFLPKMKTAEKHLQDLSPEERNMEIVDDSNTFIEMNLTLYEEEESEDEHSNYINFIHKLKHSNKNKKPIIQEVEESRVNVSEK